MMLDGNKIARWGIFFMSFLTKSQVIIFDVSDDDKEFVIQQMYQEGYIAC